MIKACKTEADGRVVEGNHTVYRISAPTPEEKEDWIKCIKYVAPSQTELLSALPVLAALNVCREGPSWLPSGPLDPCLFPA